jgi:hypothetical protein
MLCKIENTEVLGWRAAFRGMRNPKDSWDKMDSDFVEDEFKIGENDMNLALNLTKGGPEHRKFLRMLHVQFDITLPRFVWSEFDTYHHNTKNSTSTMHKLLAVGKPITLEMFDYDDDIKDVLEIVIKKIEEIRKEYVKKDCPNRNKLLLNAKRLLPEGFFQMRTVDTNYEEIRTIYHQRKYHRLPHWHEFCRWVETLPYAEEFIINK